MDALTVETRPAVIDSNFAAIRAQLVKHLAEYDEVVTIDTVKPAKARATELNKLSAEIKSRVKAAVDEASAPIAAFKDQGEELDGMVQETRQKIVDQVKAFEAATLSMAQALLQEYLEARFAHYQVRTEYQTATVEGMAKLTSLTGTGKLTSAACAEVDARINECKALQQQTDLRLSQLENESHRAGLHSPLTREHVEGVLFAPDEQYTAGLARLIVRELERQEETERRAREKAEREAREKLEQERREKAEQEAAEAAAQAVEPEPEPVAAPAPDTEPEAEPEPLPVAAEAKQAPARAGSNNTKRVRIDLVIEVEVPDPVSCDQVIKQLREKLRAAGIDRSVKHVAAFVAGHVKAA